MKRSFSFTILTTCLLLLTMARLQSALGALPIESGQSIAFLGDSITAGGAKEPGGYCRLVIDGLKQQGVEVKGVFAGISGHKSNQMLARLDKDVIEKKPAWMTLSCGVNDVWHGERGVPLEEYKKNIEQIIDKAQTAGIKVVVLTSTMIKEDQQNELNQKLLAYNAVLRELAKAKGCLLADLNAQMQDALKTWKWTGREGNKLTNDGVHMNAYGNIMMAVGILKAFGLTQDKVDALMARWKQYPDTMGVRFNINMSIAEYEAIANKSGKTPEELIKEFFERKKAELLDKK